MRCGCCWSLLSSPFFWVPRPLHTHRILFHPGYLYHLTPITQCPHYHISTRADVVTSHHTQVDTLLNKQSGLLGIAGTADLRVIAERAASGDAQAQLAMDVYVHRVRRYIGSYLVALDGAVDAVVFSAGIGENAAAIRARILLGLEGLGLGLDKARNDSTVGGRQGPVHAEGSRVQVLVIPTNEELSIAQQTLQTVHLS